MNVKLIAVILLVSVFLIGCADKYQTNGYASYNQKQDQQGQYVGGGCGVAPSSSYEDTPVNFNSANSM